MRPPVAATTRASRLGARWFRRARLRVAGAVGVGLVALGASAEPDSDSSARRWESARSVRVAPAKVSRKYDLRKCLMLAERNYPKVRQSKAQLARMRAQLDEAHYAPFSEFKLQAGIGPAPTIRGTAVYSPNTDTALTTNLALAWQVGIEGAVPLWTFGKISNLWDAAEAQIVAGEHGVKKAKNEVLIEVRRAYYGVQLARDGLHLIERANKILDKHLSALEKKVAEGDGDDIELLKLKMNRAELEARESEARKSERVAMSGLRFLTGVRGSFDIPDEPLRAIPHKLAPLPRYLQAARLFRPEINMARAGVVARRAQVELARARYYPDIGLGLTARWARAPEVTDQVNPYVRDNANIFFYGAALVLEWKLDFLPNSARVAQAEAQLEEMRALEQFALGGVGVEVEKAFAEALDAERRLDAYRRAAKYARQWLIKVQQGIDVGTMDESDIVDPAKEYATKRFQQMSATYDYNLALAGLALATGWDEMLR